MALLTVASLKSELGITDNDDDADLTAIVAGAAAAVKAYLGYDPETVSITETLNPSGDTLLTLRSAPPHCPVTVTSVWEDTGRPPVWDATTLLVAGDDYTQERPGGSALVRLGRHWPFDAVRGLDRLAATVRPDVGAVRVAYTLDTSLPLAAARRAALLEAMVSWNVTNGGFGLGAVTGESVDGLSTTVNTGLLPQRKDAGGLMSPAAAALLGPFRKIGALVA